MIPDRKEETVTNAIIDLLKDLPKEAVKTITCDRGKEFAGWKRIEEELGTNMYFADPYCAWQKGTNENSNGLLREFYPKQMDLSKTDEKEVQNVLKLLNNRPRKCINYKTPQELFNEYYVNVALDLTNYHTKKFIDFTILKFIHCKFALQAL